MINWKPHFFVFLLISILQFFLSDIVTWLYLKRIEYSLEDITSKNDLLYRDGEYKPLFGRNNFSNDVWKEEINKINGYKFAIIRHEGSNLEEIFYTKKGTKEKIRYNDNKIVYHSTEKDYPNESILIFIFSSVILFTLGGIHYRLRIGSLWPFDYFRYGLTSIEKLFLFYGAGIAVISIIVMAIK